MFMNQEDIITEKEKKARQALQEFNKQYDQFEQSMSLYPSMQCEVECNCCLTRTDTDGIE